MASVTVSSVLGNLTNSNTVSQIMGDVNSLKALSAHAPSYVANSEFQSFVANTNAYIASVDGASGLSTQTARIDLVNTNLTATNTAIRALNTATQNALDTQEAKQASDLANTNAYIGTTQGNINTQTARIDLLNTNLTSTNTAIRSTISTEVANLVDSAPGTLDTLNELAAALGDDANFSTTVTTSIATKLASANVAVYSANTNGIAQPLSSVQMSDNSVLVDPAGHLTINLGGSVYKIPYFS